MLKMIHEHNASELGNCWRAGETKFTHLPIEHKQKLMGICTLSYGDDKKVLSVAESITESVKLVSITTDFFNAYTNWPSSRIPVRDQGSCGSCWAMSSTEVLGSRARIRGVHVDLSAEPLIKWCLRGLKSPNPDMNANNTCDGSDLETPWRFLSEIGSVNMTPHTPFNCATGNTWYRATAHRSYEISTSSNLQTNIAKIKHELMTNGPVQAAFDVYEDFMNYTSGVYARNPSPSNSYLGGHAIMVIGWEGNAWICQNSWSSEWGEAGLFRIAFTVAVDINVATIEMNAYASTYNPVVVVTKTPSKKPIKKQNNKTKGRPRPRPRTITKIKTKLQVKTIPRRPRF